MCGLGTGEIVIVLVLALILLGPKRLPDVAKQVGKALRDFRRATEDLKDQFETELYREEPKTPPPALPPRSSSPLEPTVPAPATPAVPVATPDNVPGLEAAAAEPVTPPQPQGGKPTEPT